MVSRLDGLDEPVTLPPPRPADEVAAGLLIFTTILAVSAACLIRLISKRVAGIAVPLTDMAEVVVVPLAVRRAA